MNHTSLIAEIGDGVTKGSTPIAKDSDRKLHCSQQQRSQTQPKKQVRRRLHSTKPYHERPINMAEARREIVAALKFHRATMKQASQQRQQNSSQLQFHAASISVPIVDSSMEMRCWPASYTYQPQALSSNCISNSPCFQSVPHPSNFSWSCTPTVSPFPILEPVNLPLPDRPLGLSLNLHDFDELEMTVNDEKCISFSFSSSAATTSTSSSSLSSSSSYPCSSAAVFPSFPVGPLGVSEATSDSTMESLKPVLEEKEMLEVHCMENQHEIEWNDDLNLAQSAWWSTLLETMDSSSQCKEQRIQGGCSKGVGISDEISSCPPLTFNQPLLNDLCAEELFLEDACLPCLNIEDVEGMDGEWLL